MNERRISDTTHIIVLGLFPLLLRQLDPLFELWEMAASSIGLRVEPVCVFTQRST